MPERDRRYINFDNSSAAPVLPQQQTEQQESGRGVHPVVAALKSYWLSFVCLALFMALCLSVWHSSVRVVNSNKQVEAAQEMVRDAKISRDGAKREYDRLLENIDIRAYAIDRLGMVEGVKTDIVLERLPDEQ